MRKIVAAFDHAGIELHDVVVKTIKECGYEVIDVGTDSNASVDFPDYAFIGAQKILDGEADKGIFVCGSGVGMCLAANKIKGIYASVCHDTYSAHQAVEHDDINVLCLGSRVIGPELAHELIVAYLTASFNNKTNQIRRMEKVRAIESGAFEIKNNSIRLFEFGQSVWLDNISRGIIKDDILTKYIRHGIIRGITSNPSIFRKAVEDSKDYENALTPMALANKDAESIYNQLMVEDIRDAADLFRELYIQSGGNDGFVSLEISPMIAHDTDRTISEAKNLWKSVNRPNVMIKIPVTEESIPAIRELTSAGINLNLTLIFSPAKYTKAAHAYIEGLKQRLEKGESIDKIRSVASVFVSRIDTKTDAMLAEKGFDARNIIGKVAIRNSQQIYNLSREIFNSDDFQETAARGGKAQRVLWASTSTKNPLYKPTYYAEALIGENTVITMPPATLDALLKTSSIKPSIPVNADELCKFFNDIENVGIDMNDIYMILEKEGIETFIKDYQAALDTIQTRCEEIRRNANCLCAVLQQTYEKFDQDSVMRRIFSKDPTVWTFDTTAFSEIRNRLGWLDTYKNTEAEISDYQDLRNQLKKEGITKILLLGMGGSSLAPEVIASIFSDLTDIKLNIFDSTDPLQIIDARDSHDPETTLFIVSSKSGNTAEVRAFIDYFYAQATERLGENAPSHFIAITDPGTSLESIAKELGFRKIFLSDPSVGGRFSALTAFGIVPAMLMGLDAEKVSTKIKEAMKSCSPSLSAYRNEGAALGGFIGAAALSGKDKLTIITDSGFSSFGSWLEQLIAESSGKEGKGIIPIDLEPESEVNKYGNDRCFVYINSNNSHAERTAEIRKSGHPVYEIAVKDEYDLFSEFYRWEIAVAVACSVLNVNAFDQPNVQDSKSKTTAKVNEYHETHILNDLPAVWSDTDDMVDVWVPDSIGTIDECKSYNDVISRFIADSKPGIDYIAINAYIPRNTEMMTWLQKLRSMILKSTNCATTVGFGPRFQHSTGQLHKGGKNNGLFIQIVADYDQDVIIPNEDLTFGVLERAQSLGDFESLCANGRRVMRIRFKNGLPEQE